MPMKAPVHRPAHQTRVMRGVSTTTAKRMLGRKFQTRRERLMMQQPLCVECDKQGVVTVGTELDHIVPLWDGGIDHESNLQNLCHRHHADKTAREQRDRKRRASSAL
jgi:5-methylcytosine-specific restriction protein A